MFTFRNLNSENRILNVKIRFRYSDFLCDSLIYDNVTQTWKLSVYRQILI